MAIHGTHDVVLGKKEIVHANPHSVREVAATWAEFARVPPDEIHWTTTWLTSCTFACHYCLDLAAKKSSNFGVQLLTAATRDRPQ